MCAVAFHPSTPTYRNVMTNYTHLTQGQRYQISALLQVKTSISEIARTIGCHKSTISREIKRNRGGRGYRPKQANQLAKERKVTNSVKITSFGWAYIEYLLGQHYSPEQITGRLRLLKWQDVPSHETIYTYIYKDKRSGGNLHKALRSQKTYRKRGLQGQDRRGSITGRVDITCRPSIIEERSRIGDYEGDTVVGKGHQGVLVTLVDRVTRETRIKALQNRKAKAVTQACLSMLKDEMPKSITFDNGKEFADHATMATGLDTDIYFAQPYHSWERGTNENTNGLIRQFLPKSMRLDNLSDELVKSIENSLNNRPRKVLGFRTPLEVKSRFGGVALQN